MLPGLEVGRREERKPPSASLEVGCILLYLLLDGVKGWLEREVQKFHYDGKGGEISAA